MGEISLRLLGISRIPLELLEKLGSTRTILGKQIAQIYPSGLYYDQNFH